MHEVQEKILNLAGKLDLGEMSLRQIGSMVDVEHPQKIKHHIDQLVKKGLIDPNNGKVSQAGQIGNTGLFALPIVGSANCGPATILASDNIEGYLRVSRSVLSRRGVENLFVVKAIGNSLDRAVDIDGGPIEEGDYVVVDYGNRTPVNGDYVLSLIDGSANLKRLYKDEETGRIALVSESSMKIPPIYIHESDFKDFLINGVVVGVIKKPKF